MYQTRVWGISGDVLKIVNADHAQIYKPEKQSHWCRRRFVHMIARSCQDWSDNTRPWCWLVNRILIVTSTLSFRLHAGNSVYYGTNLKNKHNFIVAILNFDRKVKVQWFMFDKHVVKRLLKDTPLCMFSCKTSLTSLPSGLKRRRDFVEMQAMCVFRKYLRKESCCKNLY